MLSLQKFKTSAQEDEPTLSTRDGNMWPPSVICKHVNVSCFLFLFKSLHPSLTYFADSLGMQWNLELKDFHGMRPQRHFV
jgi:hypothetical protein